MSQLEVTIDMIVENIRARKFTNETAVREAIVMPVLAGLGWQTLDPDVVYREYPIKNRRVDYGLIAVGNTPTIIVEVKAIGQITGGDKQLFEYAFHEGVPMAILCDGREWSFYLPGEHGSYEDRRVYKLDLLERKLEEISKYLRRYLEFDRVKSGKAMQAARDDYRDASQKRQAEHTIPKDWQDIIEEPDELFIEILVEKTESICGFRPDVEQIENFIVETLVEKRITPSDPIFTPTKPPVVPPATVGKTNSTRRKSGSKEISYRLFGTEKTARTAKDALIDILRELAKRDPRFYEKLSRTAQGRRRNHLARTQEEVYPKRPDLAETAIEISPGWWIGINIANREKRRILERACEVLNIVYGKILEIEFPNA